MTWVLSITAFLVSTAIWPGFYRVDMEPRWAVLSILVPLMFARTPLRLNVAMMLTAGLAIYAGASLLWTPVLYDGLYWLWHLLLFLAVFVIASEIENMRPVYIALMIGVGLSGFVALAMQLGLIGFPAATLAAGLFVNQNFMAETAAPLLILAFHFRYWLVLPGLALAAFLPMSRAALGALVIVGALNLWRKSRMAAIAVLLTMIGALAIHADKMPGQWDSISERLNIWADSYEGMSLAGNGVGSFYALFPKEATRVDTLFNRPDHAHNELVEFTFELGIIGAVAFAALGLLAFGSSPESAALLAIILCAGFGFPLHEPCSGFIAAVVAGRLYRTRHGLRRYGAHGANTGNAGLYYDWYAGTVLSIPTPGRRNIPSQPNHAPPYRMASGQDVRPRSLGIHSAANRIFSGLRSLFKGFAFSTISARGAYLGKAPRYCHHP